VVKVVICVRVSLDLPAVLLWFMCPFYSSFLFNPCSRDFNRFRSTCSSRLTQNTRL